MNDIFHTFLYYTNDLAQDADSVALGQVADALLNAQSDGYLMPDNWRLFAAYVGIPDATALQISSPTLRRTFVPFIDPTSPTALPADNPPIVDLGLNGYDLVKTEVVQALASRGGVGAADAYVLLWAGPRKRMTPPGPIFTMQAQATITLVEGTWVQGQLTLNQTLPPGEYAIVGASAYGTNLLAVRFILKNSAYRPGVLAKGAQGEFVLPTFRNGAFGEFGRFTNYDPPLIEAVGVGAGAAQTVYLDLVKL